MVQLLLIFIKFAKPITIARLVIILLLFCAVRISAQESLQSIKFDTVHLQRGYILTVNNRSYISPKDTVLLIPSNVPYKLSRKNSGNLFEKLDSTAQYNRLTRELRNMILVQRKSKMKIETGSTTKSESNFIPYQDKIIRNITFKQLDVFGPTIEDTARIASTWLEKTGNRIHFKTKPYLLKNNLLIREGEMLDPLKLADNERILREASYTHDAKIYVKEIDSNKDSVDIFIVVKDVWPKAFDLKIDDLNGGSFSFWDRNIFGFGHENQNTLFWNSKKNPNLGYEGIYRIPNIGGSFISGKGQYYDKFDIKTYGISFDRSFFTPNIKYAGGLSFYKTSRPALFEYADTAIISPVEFNKSDFWLGKSFALNKSLSKFQSRSNLTFTLRYTNTNVTQRPLLTENQFHTYHNRTLYLSSITYSRQNYFKSNLIYNYGRAEDIPYGFQIQLNNGYEISEFKNRSFAGLNLAYASYNENFGYFYLSAGHEGFISQKKIEQGVSSASFNHFSPLYRLKKFKFRHFIDIDYTRGINRFKDEYLTINGDEGLNGFWNDSLRGNKRLNMHMETVCFSPWYFYEFRFVFFASAEFSLFGKNNDIWCNPLYSGISFGVRIRNERLVFNTLELRFHLYPNKPPYSNTNVLNISGEQVLSPKNFNARAPEISPFR